MRKFSFAGLAADNFKRNAKINVPYLITCVCTIMMFYNMLSLAVRTDLGSATLNLILLLGSIIIGVFSLVFLFYTNSFLMKRRKKEFGLFSIFGMEKRHLCKITAFETLYGALISLALGLTGGILIHKLLFLLLLRILRFEVRMGFEISFIAIGVTILLFCGIFLLILLENIRKIIKSKPIELLKGDQIGEREPKTKWGIAVIGAICLGAGYTISLTVTNVLDAIFMFFVAVLLVMAGTYCLFTAGSIAVLKLLRKSKKFYYKARHFISVSGMIYRMKQNAVGLGNICILSAAVLVVLSTTVCLYIGVEDSLTSFFPKEIGVMSNNTSNEYFETVKAAASDRAGEYGITLQDELYYTSVSLKALEIGKDFVLDGQNTASGTYAYADILFLEDYNRISGSKYTLSENEILMYTNADTRCSKLSVMGEVYDVKADVDMEKMIAGESMMGINSYYIVMKDADAARVLFEKRMETYGQEAVSYQSYYGFDTNAGSDANIALYQEMTSALAASGYDCEVVTRDYARDEFYGLYGGLFFLGIFLGFLFLMATVLVIYYKQISEGYEDKERFIVMQKVGMGDEEIRKTIKSQLLMVFFLPLVTAVIHIAFAFPIITKLLLLFNLTDRSLFLLCTLGTVLIFALLYAVVYALTAREYYKIVRW